MPVKEIGDPRLEALFGAKNPRDIGVRPTVRLPRKDVPMAVIAVAGIIFALLLFTLLNARRTHQNEPAVHEQVGNSVGWAAPPPLYIPPVTQPVVTEPETRPAVAPSPPPVVVSRPAVTPVVSVIPAPQPAQIAPPPPVPQERVSAGAPLVIDTGGGSTSGAVPVSSGATSPSTSAPSITRMRASVFANRSMTVPQGYLIPAVLETGFDSTKPGFARAIVSRDVRGFDGKNILIPRGSRLVGEYQSTTSRGQNRALITWTRLIRPDGMTITLDSPAVDTMGRGGVAASVNTHFFARFGDALLQSTMDLGRAFAGRAITGPVVVLPGSTATTAAPAIATGTSYEPTLKVPPGRSISVFVAHDLDFSAAGVGR
jgi:type IV secretion system protein VirB10